MSQINKIKEWRKKRGLSEEKLGEAVRSGRSTIVKLQDGTLPLTVEWAERLAGALECAPWDLLPDEKTESDELLELTLRWRAMGPDGKASVLNISRLIPSDGFPPGSK